MSLFKVREFWSTVCDVDEKFDQNCLKVSKLNGDTDKILIGSHNGILRVFQPSTEFGDGTNIKSFKATELLIEKIFSHPILQLSTGRLVSGSQNVHIAVLHPNSIAVYALISKDGVAEHGMQNILKLMYEHKLRRSSYNLVVGGFGGSQNRDFLCVQSLDGLLTFFEQESLVFCCFLPNFLLPGPLVYVHKTDSFIFCGSTWCVESFRYKTLSEVGHQSQEDDSAMLKVTKTWDYNLGEAIMDMQYAYNSNFDTSYIAILGERNFYCLNENGKLQFTKRFEYPTTCFYTYCLEDENKLMAMVISTTNTLLIYQNTTLKWSAQLSYSPIAVERGFFANIKGAIVSLTEDGRVDCSYLGTDPQLFAAPPLANQELDFEKAEDELASLMRIIRSYYSNDSKLTKSAAENEMQIMITINPHLEVCMFQSNLKNSNQLLMCTVTVELIPQIVIEELQLTVYVSKPLMCNNNVGFYTDMTEKKIHQCTIYISDPLEIVSLEVKVIASYISRLGIPRVIEKLATLPLKLVMMTCSPIKEGQHKITLNINQDPTPLTSLFPEFIGENSFALSSNAIGFQTIHDVGQTVTILSAKSSQRYRLHSNSLLSLNILVQQLINRLYKSFSEASDFKVSYTSALPTSELIKCVEEHYEKGVVVNELQKKLSQLGGQFRIIQKRLMSKFKDKNPTPLFNLDKLQQHTYHDIIETSTRLEMELMQMEVVQNHLSCVLELIVRILKISGLNEEVVPILETTFASVISDLNGQLGKYNRRIIVLLIKNVTLKIRKDKIKGVHANFEEVVDIKKLEKHLAQVLDRAIKLDFAEKQLMPKEQNEESNLPKRELLPIGSRIGESSSRVLSAKHGSLRRQKITE